MKQFHVLLVVENLSLGCTAKNVLKNAVSLSEAGHIVHVLSEKTGPRHNEFLQHCISIDIGGIRDDLVQTLDIIHVHGSGLFSNYLYRICEHAKQIKPDMRIFLTNIFGGFDKKMFDYIDGQAFVSKSCAHKYFTRSGRRLENEYVIYNQVFEDKNLNQQVVENARLTVGRIGRDDISKWSEDNAYIINSLRNDPVFFKLVGCPQKIRNKIINTNVEYIDSINDADELESFYQSLDVLLHLSKIGESFGCIFVEAFSYGIPVVTKSSPLKKRNFWIDNAQAEIVTARETGYVCRDDLSIIGLFKNRRNFDNFDKLKIRSHSNSRFNDKVILEGLVGAYADLTADKSHQLSAEQIKSEYLFWNDRAQLECSGWFRRLHDHISRKLLSK